MAFENPFLKPSSTRQAALKYLFSDEPASESVMSSAGSSPSFVDTFTSPSSSSNTINAIAANVLANGGEYNADQGIDASKPVDPFTTAIAFSKYGSAIKGAASLFGLGNFFNVAQQQNANDIITEMEKWGGVGADKSNVGLSILGAGLSFLGVPLAGFISGESKDAVAAVKGLASQFETPEAMKGYFTAADEQATLSRENFDGNGFLGSMAGNLAKEGDINDFGQKVYDLQSEIDKGIASGKDLGQVQASLLDKYITPDTKLSYAIPSAVYSPALATATELGKLQESNKSLAQALADVQTGVASLNFATPDDIVNALAELNYTTPEDVNAALANLNFTTPEDVINQLAESGLATTDDIANAIAGLNTPTVDNIPSVAYNPPEPVFDIGSTTPATSFQPANPDGSFVNPALNTSTSIIGDLFPEYGGMLTSPFDEIGPPLPPGYVRETSNPPIFYVPIDDGLVAPVVTLPPTVVTPSVPVDNGLTSNITDGGYVGPISYTEGKVGDVTVGAPISTDVPTPTPLPSAGGMFGTPEPAPTIDYNPPTPTFDWGSSGGDSGSSGGGGYSSSADGGWGSSNTGEW